MPWYHTPLAQGVLICWAVLAYGSLLINAWLAHQRGRHPLIWALWGYLFPIVSTRRLLRSTHGLDAAQRA